MSDEKSIDRRNFLKSGAVAGAGAALASQATAQEGEKVEDVNVALIGCGSQGQVLMNAMLNIPGVKFKAVCDIWDYSQRYGQRFLKKYDHDVNVYEDYREMLEKEKDIDAVICAAPDVWHAPMTKDALHAGKAVYCEKMMSNTIQGAREMVQAAKDTGKLLQIGHQRRSNPRYLRLYEDLITKNEIFGRLTHGSAQWNRAKTDPLGWPKKYTMTPELLKKWGYKDMSSFRNWRWYREYGGGPISDLGAHQIDIFNWFFGKPPTAVVASGGIDYYDEFEHYDNVMTIYEYDDPKAPGKKIRAYYQVLTTSSALGRFERFMGDNGTANISEDPKHNQVYKEAHAPSWDSLLSSGLLLEEPQSGIDYKPWERPKSWGGPPTPWMANSSDDSAGSGAADARETAALDAYELPTTLNKPIHQPHLENFFSAIRNGTPLNCPGEKAFETAVAVIKVNEAIAEGKRIEFKPEDFVV